MSKSVAIVTGASLGIGRATAVRLARDFSALVLVARNRANLEETTESVRTAGEEVLVIDADLEAPAVAQTVVGRTLAAFGRIDALLRNRSDRSVPPRHERRCHTKECNHVGTF